MLRKMTIGCAVVVAMLAVPATLPAQSMGGSGMHSMGGSGMHSMGGMHSSSMASRPGGVHTFSHRANFPRHHFAHFHHFRHHNHFAHFHHFRHHHFAHVHHFRHHHFAMR